MRGHSLMVTVVQFLDDAVCKSGSAKTHGKGINPIILFPVMCK